MSETKRINIDVDKLIWKEVGVFALQNDLTKKDVVNTALKMLLAQKEGNK